MWHWRFRWALACLLPTLLRIQHEVSRVQCVGLRRNDLGGVFLVAPSTLCGFPTVMQGSSGLSASQVVRCTVIHAGPEPHARGVQVWLADISGKVCQGHPFTVGLYASGGSPCRSSTKRDILRAYLPLIAPFRSMLLTARGGSCSLAPKVHEVPVYLMAFLHSYIPLARHTHSSVLVRQPNSGGNITPTILPNSFFDFANALRSRLPSVQEGPSHGVPAPRPWRHVVPSGDHVRAPARRAHGPGHCPGHHDPEYASVSPVRDAPRGAARHPHWSSRGGGDGGWRAPRAPGAGGNAQHRSAARRPCPGERRGHERRDGPPGARDFCLGRPGNPHTPRGRRADDDQPGAWPAGDTQPR